MGEQNYSCMTHLKCSLTGEKFDADRLHRTSPKTGKPLLAQYDLNLASRTLTKNSLIERPANMWRYREVLPIRDKKNIISLGEGYTPLLRSERLGGYLGMKDLWIKDEGVNPTGSFKARGLAAAVSRAHELGIKAITMPSAGNAAGAMAAYASKAGIGANVFMPKDVPLANRIECEAYGANVTLIDGLITDCGNASAKAAEKYEFFDISTMKEPYRVEGKKTMAYEIIEQMGWLVPDVIIYPTGGGTGIVGIWKAIYEMQELRLIENKKPMLISVQATGCAPIFEAFSSGKKFATEFKNPKTIASGMRVPAAIGDFLVLEAIRESEGCVTTVSDESMVDSVRFIAQMEGIFTAPEGASTFSALKKLLDTGFITKDMSVVLMNTGSGLKYLDVMKSLSTD
jgi:threonine synthase|tara:strand:- start:432 stop:1628 length:1197 start_codon:yes stop_codon:yes gene_type:complete